MIFSKFKIYIILIIAIFILLSTVSVLVHTLSVRTAQRNRAENNYRISTDTINNYIDKTGKMALRIDELQLSSSQIEKSSDSIITKLLRENKNLGNKLKNTKQLLNIKTSTNDTIVLIMHDTLIYRLNDTITQLASYSDTWLDVKLNIHQQQIEMEYIFRDDLIISIGWHRARKKFPPWNWLGFGKKIYDTDIKSLNPSSNITYSKNIRITGKQGR